VHVKRGKTQGELGYLERNPKNDVEPELPADLAGDSFQILDIGYAGEAALGKAQ
jgi:hypothetical protein